MFYIYNFFIFQTDLVVSKKLAKTPDTSNNNQKKQNYLAIFFFNSW